MARKERGKKLVARLLQNIRGWIWHIFWQSVGFSRMARGRTNLDGYLLTHTVFCCRLPNFPSFSHSRKWYTAARFTLRELSSSARELVASHSSPYPPRYCIVLYCIKAVAHVAAWQKQARVLQYRATSLRSSRPPTLLVISLVILPPTYPCTPRRATKIGPRIVLFTE